MSGGADARGKLPTGWLCWARLSVTKHRAARARVCAPRLQSTALYRQHASLSVFDANVLRL
jgi:hypothetical protein